MTLSIIIVNYNACEYIVACIESALQFQSSENFEWIIVDNNSTDNSRIFLTKKFPFIKWIDMHYNAGFARANNAGINKSTGNAVLLLNPDTIITDDCINYCIRRFETDIAIACSVQLKNPDGSPQITGNYFMKGGLNHLLPLPYLGRFLRSIAFLFKAKKTNVQQASSREKVDWINGAFLMIKKSVIEKAGLMDEEFFLYAEESEWCSRLGKFGELVVYGDLKIIHLQGEIINKETETFGKGYFDLYSKKGLQLIVSNTLRIRKQYGIGWYLLNISIYILEIPVLYFFYICNKIRNKKNQKKYISAKDYRKNVFILLSLSLRIIFRKKHLYKML